MLLEHPNGRGRTEHHRYFVFLNQAPPHATVWPGRQAFVHDGGHSSNQRTVDDVAVSHHPTNVAGRKVGFTGIATINMFHAGSQCHGITTGVSLYALGFARGTAGVERIAGMGRIYPHARHLHIHMNSTQVSPKVVAASNQAHGCQLAVHHQHRCRFVGRQSDGLVQQRLVLHHLAPAGPGIGAHDDGG